MAFVAPGARHREALWRSASRLSRFRHAGLKWHPLGGVKWPLPSVRELRVVTVACQELRARLREQLGSQPGLVLPAAREAEVRVTPECRMVDGRRVCR